MSGFMSPVFAAVPFETSKLVPGHASIPGNKPADSLPKARDSHPTAMVSSPPPLLSPKLVTPSITNEDVAFLQSPSHLNCPVPRVSPLELVLLRP